MSSLDAVLAEADGGCTLTVAGDLDIVAAPELRSLLARAIDEHGGDVVLDVAGVGFIDSSGLGVLIGATRRLRSDGRRLVVRNPTPAVQRLLDTTGAGGVFTVEA